MTNEKTSQSIVVQLKHRYRNYRSLYRQHSERASRADTLRYFVPWMLSLRAGHSPIQDQRIWIVFKAKSFLDRVLRPSMKVFEYGMGGSTLFFLSKGCEVWSVDHHPDWYKAVEAEIAARKYKNWHGFLRPPDPEGMVLERSARCSYRSAFGEFTGRTFSRYAKVIDEFADGFFDAVLIDGRGRDSCFIHAREKVKAGGWLILDNSERERYQAVHRRMSEMGWIEHRFFGPGPYVTHEFWETVVWQRPARP